MPGFTGSELCIRGVLFDRDGTLVDSEPQTDDAVADVMAELGHDGVQLAASETRGRSWPDIVATLIRRYELDTTAEVLEAQLIAHWSASTGNVTPIPGAANAVRKAAEYCQVAVVSSSPHAMISRFLQGLGVDSVVPDYFRIGADEIERHKPDPQGFILAAHLMGVTPEHCMVFEDSCAGLRASRDAGMDSVAILHRCAEPQVCRDLATATLTHYDELPTSFWRELAIYGAEAFAA